MKKCRRYQKMNLKMMNLDSIFSTQRSILSSSMMVIVLSMRTKMLELSTKHSLTLKPSYLGYVVLVSLHTLKIGFIGPTWLMCLFRTLHTRQVHNKGLRKQIKYRFNFQIAKKSLVFYCIAKRNYTLTIFDKALLSASRLT